LAISALLLAVFFGLTPQENAIAIDCNARDGKPSPCLPPREPLKRAKSALVDFATSPFPYDSTVPEKDQSFLNVIFGWAKGTLDAARFMSS
jgi:hypothetical protein